MIASRLIVYGLLLGVAVSACHQDAVVSALPEAGKAGPQLSTQHVTLMRHSSPMNAKERAIIDRIVAQHPPESAASLRAMLSNRFVQLTFPSNSADQLLLNELLAARAQQPAPAAEPVQATVVLVDHLSDPRASAIVVRRTDAEPHDVIMLGSNNATTAAFGSAVSALFKMRRSMGDLPTRDARVIVRGAAVPAWVGGAQGHRAEMVLADLQSGPLRSIAGLGAVRAIEIPLKRTNGGNSGESVIPR